MSAFTPTQFLITKLSNRNRLTFVKHLSKKSITTEDELVEAFFVLTLQEMEEWVVKWRRDGRNRYYPDDLVESIRIKLLATPSPKRIRELLGQDRGNVLGFYWATLPRIAAEEIRKFDNGGSRAGGLLCSTPLPNDVPQPYKRTNDLQTWLRRQDAPRWILDVWGQIDFATAVKSISSRADFVRYVMNSTELSMVDANRFVSTFIELVQDYDDEPTARRRKWNAETARRTVGNN